MKTITEKAYAKLNLSLDVLGTMPDGYHEMRMVMQSISLCDDVTLTLTDSGQIRVRTNFGFLPTDGRNIAVKAALAFFTSTGREGQGLDITLKKRTPVCAGMGGGSSDAAAVLRGLNILMAAGLSMDQLEELARGLGSDVAFCVRGGTQLAVGRGDVLQALSALPDCAIVVCKPRFAISTPELFKLIDARKSNIHPDTDGILAALDAGDLNGVARRMYNVFADVLPRKYSGITAIKNQLLDLGASGTIMTGTGSAVFGLFADAVAANAAHTELAERYQECYLARPVGALG